MNFRINAIAKWKYRLLFVARRAEFSRLTLSPDATGMFSAVFSARPKVAEFKLCHKVVIPDE